MAYESLITLFNRNRSSSRYTKVEQEARRRLHDDSAFRTGIMLEHGELFFTVPSELTVLMERVLRVERKVSHLWRDLPIIAQRSYILGLIINEVVSSNEMEGIDSTRKQIEDALKSIAADTPSREQRRFREFTSLYLGMTEPGGEFPKSPADIRAIYDKVVAGELEEADRPDGELFRREGVDIVTTGHSVVHRGVVPESAIIEMLAALIAMTVREDIPALYGALLAHFVFEYVHPFYDGNGRTGRYLLALYLARPLSLPTVLSLSRTIADNKSSYYRTFRELEDPVNHAEATIPLIKMMELLRLAQEYVLEDLEAKRAAMEYAQQAIRSIAGLSSGALSVLGTIAYIELFTTFESESIHSIAHYAKLSTVTARKYTRELEAAGYLIVLSQRPLMFSLSDAARVALRIPYNLARP
ncbi:MAG: Fic family protein [Coriobacteriales bacterium]|jgi:Fic family protein|nr:Fic family protein [Coriobacteriales bacterium]